MAGLSQCGITDDTFRYSKCVSISVIFSDTFGGGGTSQCNRIQNNNNKKVKQ